MFRLSHLNSQIETNRKKKRTNWIIEKKSFYYELHKITQNYGVKVKRAKYLYVYMQFDPKLYKFILDRMLWLVFRFFFIR